MQKDLPSAKPATRERVSVKGEATRLALMQAARTVFAREGFANAEIGQITHAAGKAKGTFYLYFENKTHLLKAMVEAVANELRQPEVLAQPLNPPEQIRHVLAAIWTANKRHGATFRALADASTRDPELAKLFADLRSNAKRDFAAMIATRQSEGACRHLDCAFASEALETMVTRSIHQWLAMGKSIQTDDDERRAFNTLVRLMRTAFELPGEG